jgi:hypothetical protein
MDVIRTVVIAPSPMPINAWKIIIGGKMRLIPPGNAGATSKVVINAPSITEVHEAKKTLEMKRLVLLLLLVKSLTKKKLKPPIIAMLKRFMPKATIPPSAKNVACIVSTRVMLRIAAYGPSKTARNVPPTKCPLVPKTIGKFIICAANMKALEMASSAVMERV